MPLYGITVLERSLKKRSTAKYDNAPRKWRRLFVPIFGFVAPQGLSGFALYEQPKYPELLFKRPF